MFMFGTLLNEWSAESFQAGNIHDESRSEVRQLTANTQTNFPVGLSTELLYFWSTPKAIRRFPGVSPP
jgi:hypothetical protein